MSEDQHLDHVRHRAMVALGGRPQQFPDSLRNSQRNCHRGISRHVRSVDRAYAAGCAPVAFGLHTVRIRIAVNPASHKAGAGAPSGERTRQRLWAARFTERGLPNRRAEERVVTASPQTCSQEGRRRHRTPHQRAKLGLRLPSETRPDAGISLYGVQYFNLRGPNFTLCVNRHLAVLDDQHFDHTGHRAVVVFGGRP